MLEPEERHRLLIEWNDTERVSPTDLALGKLFERQAEKTPNAIAAILEGEALSYNDLNTRSSFLAHRLSSLGVEVGDVVGLCFERSLDFLVALFAVVKTGAAFVPLDPDYPDSRLLNHIADAAAKLMLSHSALDHRLAGCAVQRIDVDKFNWANANRSVKPFPIRASIDSLMYVMYTSGSSGRPKGVELAQRGVLNLLHWLQAEHPIKPGHRLLQMASIAFDYSIVEVFWPLVNGATLIVSNEGEKRNVPYLVNTLKEQDVTHLITGPSMLRALLHMPEVSMGESLQFVACGGEALTVELNERFHQSLNAELFNWYGPTETTVFSTSWKSAAGAKVISLGRPIANTQIYLFDPSGEPVPVGESGEICIGGEGIAMGYRNLPDQTAESFAHNSVPEVQGKILYRSGDLAKFHPDGTLEFLGRIDDQIQLRGFRVEPAEIETLLNQRSDVRESAVVLREHGPNDQRLHAFYVPFSDADKTEPDELRNYLAGHLPEVMVPSSITQVDALPHTVSGKLDRKSLILDTPGNSTPKPIGAARSDTATISMIFEEVLGYGAVGQTDSFFGLGGHSLLAIKVINMINNRFQVNLSVRAIFDGPTPVELADCVHQAKNNPSLP